MTTDFSKRDLTLHEAMMLGMVYRFEPITPYRAAKLFRSSPVETFNGSNGQLYPVIKRLEEFGYVEKRRVAGDARGTGTLHCTETGGIALKMWVMGPESSRVLPEDSLRSKVIFFDLLTDHERIEWIIRSKKELEAKQDEFESFVEPLQGPFKSMVEDNVISSLKARLDWLDRMLSELVIADFDQAENE